MSSNTGDTNMSLLRHVVATLAYWGAKMLKGAPPDFPAFAIAAGTRTPVQILAHIGDLLEWMLRLAQGTREWKAAWKAARPSPWEDETARFLASLRALDDYLASGAPLGFPAETLFPGAALGCAHPRRSDCDAPAARRVSGTRRGHDSRRRRSGTGRPRPVPAVQGVRLTSEGGLVANQHAAARVGPRERRTV